MSNWPGQREYRESLATCIVLVLVIYESIELCLSDRGTVGTWFRSLLKVVAVVLTVCFFTTEDFFSVDIFKDNEKVTT